MTKLEASNRAASVRESVSPFLLSLLATLILIGCGQQPTHVKVIVGAQLPASGIEYSVVVIDGDKIRAVGKQSDVPVPKGSEITSGLGKIIEGSNIDAGQPANLTLLNAQTHAIERVMEKGTWK